LSQVMHQTPAEKLGNHHLQHIAMQLVYAGLMIM